MHASFHIFSSVMHASLHIFPSKEKMTKTILSQINKSEWKEAK